MITNEYLKTYQHVKVIEKKCSSINLFWNNLEINKIKFEFLKKKRLLFKIKKHAEICF
jgi:hypothetical protein